MLTQSAWQVLPCARIARAWCGAPACKQGAAPGSSRPQGSLTQRPRLQVSAGGLQTLLSSRSNSGDEASLDLPDYTPLTVERVRGIAKVAAEQVKVPKHVINLLVDLRSYLQDKVEPPVYVSDRRIVKAMALLQVRLLLSPRWPSQPVSHSWLESSAGEFSRSADFQ